MKYLRGFNESNVSKSDKISPDQIIDIEDILLEVKDMGYNISINKNIGYYITPSTKKMVYQLLLMLVNTTSFTLEVKRVT